MAHRKSDRNIVLIGMPGAGKSTVGVLLAKATARTFIDVDLLIQTAENLRLQELIDRRGLEAFLDLEERHILGLTCMNAVIATGGSVVYCESAMAYLREGGIVVYLEAPLEVLQGRALDFEARGIVRKPGQNLAALYAERDPLYRRYAELTVSCGVRSHAEVLEALLKLMPQ